MRRTPAKDYVAILSSAAVLLGAVAEVRAFPWVLNTIAERGDRASKPDAENGGDGEKQAPRDVEIVSALVDGAAPRSDAPARPSGSRGCGGAPQRLTIGGEMLSPVDLEAFAYPASPIRLVRSERGEYLGRDRLRADHFVTISSIRTTGPPGVW